MLKMSSLFSLLFLCLLGLTGVGGEEYSIELLNLCETNEAISQSSTNTDDLPIAVSVSNEDLNGVSRSILLAETWLRSNVLAHYPAAKITTILVGNNSPLFCQGEDQHKNLGMLLLPSLKNVYHSLKRWGLEKDIKVSFAFHLECLTSLNPASSHNLKMMKTLIEYLNSVNSTYSLIPHSGFSHFSDKSLSLVSSHLESMKKLGFLFYPNNVNVVAMVSKGRKPSSRKLSVVFPIIPSPFPEMAEPPLQYSSSVGNPAPSNVATKPLPPMPSSTFAPELPPPPFFNVPGSAPNSGFTLPPCNPIDYNGVAPSPEIVVPVQKLWCVAKPNVPPETLQEALDYACGEGDADCEEITPQGNCFNPDTVVAHASYAFNSYWQKHKRHGGTCSFGGTAMLINADPSFLHCRFILS